MTAREYVELREGRGATVKRASGGSMVTCPAHDDRSPSLHVSEGPDGRVLLKCHAGCETADVLAADGRDWGDLFPNDGKRNGRVEVAAYDYVDEQGELLFQCVRFYPKDFSQRRPRAGDRCRCEKCRGGKDADRIWNLHETRRVLYRLPKVVKAVRAGARIYIAEGEKDVHALERAGQAATCNPMGAGKGKWLREYAEMLRGAHVVVVADKDKEGREHAERIVGSLRGVAASVEVVEAAEGKDATDHLAAGRAVEEFVPVGSSASGIDYDLLRGHRVEDDERGDRTAAVRFVSPAELLASAPAEPPWCWHGYLAVGAVTLLAGKPKSGKSTIGFAIAQAIDADDGEFLGHPISGGPVVYVSEEGASTLVHKVAGNGLRIATRETAWPRPDWAKLIEIAEAEAERVGAVLVVIDTFAFWAALGPDGEKDAGAAQAAMAPLIALARHVAVLLIAHTRKGGGEDGEAVRGSSAIAGAVDIVLEIERVADLPRQRKLLALSRYPQTPGALVFQREAGDWSVIGEGTDRGDARDIANRGVLLDALDFGEDRTRAEIEEATGVQAREWHATLDQLIADEIVTRSGEGKRGDPYRYRKVRETAAQKPAETGVSGVSVSAAPRRGAETKPETLRRTSVSAEGAHAETPASDVKGGSYCPRCTCADGGADPTEDGRCSRCFGTSNTDGRAAAGEEPTG